MIIDFAIWGWQQWYFAIVWPISILLNTWLHGHPRTGRHNGVVAIISTMLGAFILYTGGFFS